MSRYDAMPPKGREALTTEQVEEMKASQGFQFKEYFVYQRNEIFLDYEIKMRDGTIRIENHYLISFKDTHKVECKGLDNPASFPVEAKLLQLSVDSRRELEVKFQEFYRLPKEDLEA